MEILIGIFGLIAIPLFLGLLIGTLCPTVAAAEMFGAIIGGFAGLAWGYYVLTPAILRALGVG